MKENNIDETSEVVNEESAKQVTEEAKPTIEERIEPIMKKPIVEEKKPSNKDKRLWGLPIWAWVVFGLAIAFGALIIGLVVGR